MATQLTAVPYFGGKARIRLHDWIQSHLDKGQIYVEPFAGALSILLNRERSYFECANDLDGNVVNFFRCLRDHGGELLEKLRLTPISREEFVHCQHTLEHNEPDDIEQARCWYVLVHQSRAGAFAHRWKASEETPAGRVREPGRLYPASDRGADPAECNSRTGTQSSWSPSMPTIRIPSSTATRRIRRRPEAALATTVSILATTCTIGCSIRSYAGRRACPGRHQHIR